MPWRSLVTRPDTSFLSRARQFLLFFKCKLAPIKAKSHSGTGLQEEIIKDKNNSEELMVGIDITLRTV